MSDPKVLFRRGDTQFVEALPVLDGQLVYNTDTGETYLDIGFERILTGRFGGAGGTYVYDQIIPEDTWRINHGLDKYPAISVVDSAGSVMIGDIQYINKNEVIIKFNGGFAGKAYFN